MPSRSFASFSGAIKLQKFRKSFKDDNLAHLLEVLKLYLTLIFCERPLHALLVQREKWTSFTKNLL